MHIWLCIFLWLAVTPTVALAVECTDADEARDKREEAAAAVGQWQFARAEELLRASLELCAEPQTAQNLAGVLRELGRTSAALTLLDAVLRQEYGAVDRTLRAHVRAQRLSTLQTLSTLDVIITGASEGRLLIDGREVGSFHEATRSTLRLDPGPHTLRVRAGGFVPVDRDVTLETGAAAELEIALPEGEEARLIVVAPPDRAIFVDDEEVGRERARLMLPEGDYRVRVEDVDEVRIVPLIGGTIVEEHFLSTETPIARRPWFWAAIGAAAVIVVTVIVLGVVLSADANSLQHPLLGDKET